MKPEVGDIWKWCGGQHFLILGFAGTVDHGYNPPIDKWWVLDLQDGNRNVFVFDSREIADKSWEKVA